MKEILDEHIEERPWVLPKKTLPKYIIWWQLVLLALIVLNIAIGAYQWFPVVFLHSVVLPYVLLSIISGVRYWTGEIHKFWFLIFLSLCVYTLSTSLIFAGKGILMWLAGSI